MEGCLYWKIYKSCIIIASLKMEGIVNWRGLKSQGPLYNYMVSCLFLQENQKHSESPLDVKYMEKKKRNSNTSPGKESMLFDGSKSGATLNLVFEAAPLFEAALCIWFRQIGFRTKSPPGHNPPPPPRTKSSQGNGPGGQNPPPISTQNGRKKNKIKTICNITYAFYHMGVEIEFIFTLGQWFSS